MALGLPIGTVRTHLHRGRRKLREEIQATSESNQREESDMRDQQLRPTAPIFELVQTSRTGSLDQRLTRALEMPRPRTGDSR